MAPIAEVMDGAIGYWLILLAKALIWVAEIFTDLFFGYTITAGWRDERRRSWLHHEYSAQVVKVFAKAHYTEVTAHSGKNFLYTHQKYVSPKYVLENPHVTLFTVDTKYVYFCETDPDVEIYNTIKHPFVFMAHYNEVKKLVIMSIDSFHRMADELGDPKVPVCLVNMTARCGSTLVSQMMNRVPDTRSMSEPFALFQVNNHFRKRWFNGDQTRKMIQSCMRVHCKVEPSSKVRRIIIKMTPSTSPMFVIIHELFPKFDLIFNTRHPKPSILSLNKVMTSIQERSIYFTLQLHLNNFPHDAFPFLYHEKYLEKTESLMAVVKNYSLDNIMAVVYAAVFLTYANAKHIYKHVVLYENLVSNPEREAKKLFSVLNISEKYIPAALEALKQDSQKSTFGKREDKPMITDDKWEKQDEILQTFIPQLRCSMTKDEFKSVFNS